MLHLLTAAAGAAFPDRPDWPALPVLEVDERPVLHARPRCRTRRGRLRRYTDTVNVTDLTTCHCVEEALAGLEAHPVAAELAAAETVLAAAAVAQYWAGAWDHPDEPTPATALRVLLAAGAHEQVLTRLSRDRLTHYDVLSAVIGGLDAARAVSAGLDALPQALRTPVKAATRRHRHGLRDALDQLREVLDDATLSALANAVLRTPAGPVTGTALAFWSGAVESVRWRAFLLEQLWPGQVYPRRDRSGVLARVPAAFALAWLDGAGAELVTADAAAAAATREATAPPPAPRVHLAAPDWLDQLTPIHLQTAANLWSPGSAQLDAAAALQAAVDLHAPAPRLDAAG